MEKVIIFGASGMGKYVYYSLDINVYEVIAFTDNWSDIHGQRFCGIEIINPAEIPKMQYDKIIISLPEYEVEIKSQLIQLGVRQEDITTFNKYENGTTWVEPRYAMARNCMEQVIGRNINGNAAELGVYQGEFAAFINACMPDKKIYLFDTFDGFCESEIIEGEFLTGKDNFKDTSVDLVINKMTTPENVIIKKGWFPDSANDVEDSFAFVSLDADLYEPIYNGLEFFYPRLAKGGYIFIHDFDSRNWTGVKKAVYDFCKKNNVSFVPILDKCLSAVITK